MSFAERQELLQEIVSTIQDVANGGPAFPLLEIVLTIVLSGIVFFIASYLVQRGKNHATKEDLAALTTEVESVKDVFSRDSMRDETLSLIHI